MRIAACSLLLFLSLACRPGVNYPDPASPRYADSAMLVNKRSTSDTLRIVSFNIEYARETRRAAQILSTVATLRDADVVLLQEMTAPATKFLADSLHMRSCTTLRYTIALCGGISATRYCRAGRLLTTLRLFCRVARDMRGRSALQLLRPSGSGIRTSAFIRHTSAHRLILDGKDESHSSGASSRMHRHIHLLSLAAT